MAIVTVLAIMTLLAIETVIHLFGIEPSVKCRVAPRAPSTSELSLFFHDLSFLVIVEIVEMTQVFASRASNVGSSSCRCQAKDVEDSSQGS